MLEGFNWIVIWKTFYEDKVLNEMSVGRTDITV